MNHADRSILIIEDNPDDGLLTIRAFKKLNFKNVTLAETGTEALQHIFGEPDSNENKTELNRPDLILLDLNLPVIDGFSVLRKIRADQRTRTIPIIVLTSSGEESDIEKSYELGANSYIRKPVDFLEFEKAALLISEYWLTLNVPAGSGS